MSATVIDSLIITLGLDGTNYQKNKELATQANKQLRDDASRTATELSSHGKEAGEFFGGIKKEMLGLFAVVAGGKGLEQLFLSAVNTSAAVGRTAGVIGTTTEKLSAWNNLAKQAGASTDAMSGSLTTLASNMENNQYGPNAAIGFMQQNMGIQMSDANGAARDPSDIMVDVSHYFKTHTGPQDLFAAQQISIDPSIIPLLQQGITTGQLASQGNVSAKDAAAAIAEQKAWAQLNQEVETLANNSLPLINSYVIPALKTFGTELDTFSKNFVNSAFYKYIVASGPDSNAQPLNQAMTYSQEAGKWLHDKLDHLLHFPNSKGNFFPNFGSSNNPGNLRYAGQPGAHADANGFAVFDNPAAGMDALKNQLHLYGNRGLDTLNSLITTYEGAKDPNDTGAGNPDHNNVKAYIAEMKQYTGFDADEPLDMNDPAVLSALSNGIAIQEGHGSSFPGLNPFVKTPIQPDQITAAVRALHQGTYDRDGGSRDVHIGHIEFSGPVTNAEHVSKQLRATITKHMKGGDPVNQANRGLQ